MTRRLGVNIDHVATLRQARRARHPDPLAAALLAERAGAAQITAHVRGDRRHIQDADLYRLRASVQTLLNVEAALTAEMIALLSALRPHRVTWVAERPGEVTTEGGLDVVSHRELVVEATAALTRLGVHVSVFIDPEPAQVEACRLPGVDMVELNTASWSEHGTRAELGRLAEAAELAGVLGFELAAGHGLTLHNLRPLVEAAPSIVEYNIGHALVGDAVFLGLEAAVARYRALLA